MDNSQGDFSRIYSDVREIDPSCEGQANLAVETHESSACQKTK